MAAGHRVDDDALLKELENNEAPEDEDEAFVDDIRGAHHRLRTIHSDHGSSSDFGTSSDDD